MQGSRKEAVRAPGRENEKKGAYLRHIGDRVYRLVWERGVERVWDNAGVQFRCLDIKGATFFTNRRNRR